MELIPCSQKILLILAALAVLYTAFSKVSALDKSKYQKPERELIKNIASAAIIQSQLIIFSATPLSYTLIQGVNAAQPYIMLGQPIKNPVSTWAWLLTLGLTVYCLGLLLFKRAAVNDDKFDSHLFTKFALILIPVLTGSFSVLNLINSAT